MLVLLVVAVIAALSMFSSTKSDASRASVPAFQSADIAKIYLPFITKNYPLRTVFGVEMSSITTNGGLDQMVAANTNWVRRNALLWSDVSPSFAAERNWNASSVVSLETELINASGKGIQVILIVRSTPSWAQQVSGSFCGPMKLGNFVDFANFMNAAVARYSVPPYNVKYWEIWNEPDVEVSVGDPPYGCWGNPTDPYYGGGYYAQMLSAVYPQIKAADPKAQVLVGGLLLDCDPRGSPSVCASLNPPRDDKPAKFLQGILAAGGGPNFDGVSFHAYDYYAELGKYGNGNWSSAWNTTGPVGIAKADFVASVLSSGGASKFLMNTESALLCDSCTSDAAFETAKAYYVTQDYAAAIAQGIRANLWYSVLGWRNSGLLEADLTPRLAYTATLFARTELGAPTFTGKITSSDIGGTLGVAGYKFYRDGRAVWVLWSQDGIPHIATFPSVPLAVWDALGNSVTPAGSLTIDLKPLYVELP